MVYFVYIRFRLFSVCGMALFMADIKSRVYRRYSGLFVRCLLVWSALLPALIRAVVWPVVEAR